MERCEYGTDVEARGRVDELEVEKTDFECVDVDADVCAAEGRFRDSSITRLFGISGGSIGNVPSSLAPEAGATKCLCKSDAAVGAIANASAVAAAPENAEGALAERQLFEAEIGTPADPKASPTSLGCLSSICFFMAEIRTNFFRQTGQL